jgi:lysophospholipase L1-like esterase
MIQRLLAILCVAATCLGAAEFKKPVTSLDLQNGDTLVFLGDSITHQVLYTQYVEDYYYTRYPNRRIRFHNAGVSGDKAFHALDRFDGDVAPFKPKYVTILLGMNDGTYQHFNHEIFATYEKDMTTLADRIAEIGATAIFMGPPMYDSRVASVKPPRWLKNQDQVKEATMYYNAVLAFYGTWARDTALNRGLGYVDMLGPLNRHSAQQRLAQPDFTVIPDAVHPDANGQAIMAFELLEQMNANRSVGAVTATRTGDKWRVVSGSGKISDVQAPGEGLAFTYLANSLPWVLPEEAKIGYELTKAGHKLSNERLVIRGLKPGKYTLTIDGTEVGDYTHAHLGAKIELQSNAKTPQYQQALQVALLNKERNEKVIRPLRNQWGSRKGVRSRELEKNDPAKYAEWKEKFETEVARLLKEKANYEDRIYQLNQPAPRHYELRPAGN